MQVTSKNKFRSLENYDNSLIQQGKEIGHDICGYCGTDNGIYIPGRGGELRNGFDCYYCGGN